MTTNSNSPFLFEPILFPQEPTTLRAGDTWQWQRVFEGYPSGLGWTAQYILNSAQARYPFPADAATPSGDGSSFAVAVSSSDSATVAPGTYDLYVVLSNLALDLQQTFPLQTVRVSPNILAASVGVDTRSFVKRTLDILEAAIAGNTSAHIQEYEINGRRIQFMDRLALTKLRDKYKYEYRQEQAAAGEYVPKRRVGVCFRPNY